MTGETDTTIGMVTTQAGALTALGSVPLWLQNEATVLLITSGIGAAVAVLGFVYTIILGERKHRLAKRRMELLTRQAELGRLRMKDLVEDE